MRVLLIMFVIGIGIACTLKTQYDKELKPVPVAEVATEEDLNSAESTTQEAAEQASRIIDAIELSEEQAKKAVVKEPVAQELVTPLLVDKSDPFFKENIKPFINQYCSDCHNNKKQKGKLNLEPIHGFEANLESVDLWQEIHDLLEEDEMPPEDETQPSADEKEKIMTWIAYNIDSKRDEMKNAAFTHLRRLNKVEYDRTIADLLKIDTKISSLSESFPADDLVENLKNNGEALQVSAFHLGAYVEAAEKAVEKAILFGSKPEVAEKTYRPPYSKSRNVLKAARNIGKDKFVDLVETRSFAFHPNQLKGVPESGYYKVTAKVQARNRVHDLKPKGFPIPQENPLRASIVLTNPSTGDSNYFTISDRTAEEFELPDEKVVKVSGKYWIEKGYAAKIGFPTSVPHFKSAKRMGIDQKKFKKFFTKKGAYAGFLQSQTVMQDHGPVLRVFDYKIEGPFFDEWPKPSHRNLFGTQTLAQVNLNKAIDSFAVKAFRRPIQADDTAAIKTMMSKMQRGGFTKLEALKAGLVAVLSSPQFFYLIEQKGQLDDYALASRLSYFLWSTMPDEELMSVAKAGKLSNPQELERQALRMMKSPKVDGFVNNFSDGWLELNKLGTMPPDRKTTPEYYLYDLENAGRQETIHFVKNLLTTNGKLSDFLNSDYTFMNNGLAKFYGHEKAASFGYDEYTKTKITDPRRGGSLGQMSLLTATANGVDTTPIIRGMWVLENLFGEHLEARPGVSAVEPDVRGAKTLRQLLEKHRDDKNCYACHKKIDPPGFALENFDQIGRWRTIYNEHLKKSDSRKAGIEQKLPVDAKGEMTSGEKFEGIIEFKKILMGKQDTFTKALAGKLLAYSTGREIRSFEKPSVEKIAKDQKNFRDLMISVVKSEMFRRK
ncbi:MAG: DUF1592 domain-containing protein [Lentisphaeraceae bacterium]|nr:DUF1592 domain-containing protein [Lentisphaeraceae bacterium]